MGDANKTVMEIFIRKAPIQIIAVQVLKQLGDLDALELPTTGRPSEKDVRQSASMERKIVWKTKAREFRNYYKI